MDLNEAITVILARERGYNPAVVNGNGISTPVACKRLSLSPTELLRLRRRLLEPALGVAKLPPLTFAEVKQTLSPERTNA